MPHPLIDKIIDVLDKIQFEEAIQLRRELQMARTINPHMEGLLQMKLQVLKAANKNMAKAVEACEALELTEQAMELYAVLNKEHTEVSQEANK